MSQPPQVITAGNVPKKVMYRLAGKLYSVADEQGPGNPFEEIIIPPGQSWALPEGAKFLKAVDLEGTLEKIVTAEKSGDD